MVDDLRGVISVAFYFFNKSKHKNSFQLSAISFQQSAIRQES